VTPLPSGLGKQCATTHPTEPGGLKVETCLQIIALAVFGIITLLASVRAISGKHARAAIITLAALGILAQCFHIYLVEARSDAAVSRRRAIRVKMAELVHQGRALKRRCANESQPPPTDEANAWAVRTEAFLRANLDESYVARFRNWHGIYIGPTSIQSAPHRSLSTGLYVRLARLNQFLEELGERHSP